VLDEFEDSVPMSTYLVAYMVSDFAYIESDDGDDQVKFRIVVRKDAADQTELAKNAGPLVLKYYEDYFDEKFPLSKQDMVAIPDFSAGAMENWGLVTYRYVTIGVRLYSWDHEYSKNLRHMRRFPRDLDSFSFPPMYSVHHLV